MVTLLILRHAKAAAEEPGSSDRDRRLTPGGELAASAVGQRLAESALIPDCILCSSARRARDTAHRVARTAGFQGSILELDELYLAPPELYLRALEGSAGAAKRVLLVGHNPDLEALVMILTGEVVAFPPAGLAECTLPIAAFAELSGGLRGKLRRFVAPKAGAD